MILKIAASSVVAIALLSAAPAMAETQKPQTQSPMTGTATVKATKADQAFIKKAIEGNLAEVKLGQLSQEKGANAEVKTYGQMLVTDHGSANDKATAAAQAAGVTPPTAPSSKQRKTYDGLAKLSGATFDRRFAADMVQDHKADIAEYAKASKGSGPIADYAKAALPTLHEHLQKAEALEKDLKASGKRSAK
jgi:putative membrane protein